MDQSIEPAIIHAIMLSDGAIREAGTNKLTLIGLFGNWNAPGFPFRTPPFCITPFITNLKPSDQPRNISVRIENMQSRVVVFSMGGKFMVAGNVSQNAVGDGPIPVPMGMILPEAGRYRIYVLIDGEEIATRDFDVTSMTAPQIIPNQPK